MCDLYSILPSVLFRDEATYPGIVFHENPIQETLTFEEREINYEKEMGISIFIPENSVRVEETIGVVIQPSFSGTFAGPADLEPVSPAYLVKTEGEAQLQRDITVKIQHNASIETEEDCKDLFFLKASSSPSYRGPLFGPIYIFHEIDRSKVKFGLESRQFGEAKVKDLSWFMIWRKISGHWSLDFGKSLYSVRLYKGSRNEAVFCMCQQHPQFTKVILTIPACPVLHTTLYVIFSIVIRL